MLISDNLPVRKSYFDSNIIENENARILPRFFLRIILKRTSTEARVYMRRHQRAKVKHFDVSNVIYHKFSHGAVSYTLNGKKVNVMLEYHVMWRWAFSCITWVKWRATGYYPNDHRDIHVECL